jgi:hypothetical protein
VRERTHLFARLPFAPHLFAKNSIQEPLYAIFFLRPTPGFCKKEVHQKGGDPVSIGKRNWTGEVIVT